MLVKARKGKRNMGWRTYVFLAAQVLEDHLGLVMCEPLWRSLGSGMQVPKEHLELACCRRFAFFVDWKYAGVNVV